MDSCGTASLCGHECGLPGLRIRDSNCPICNPVADPSCAPVPDDGFATISTSDWEIGLALNILMTDARMPSAFCEGTLATGGHWSESYIEGGPPFVGSLLRNTTRKSTRPEAEAEIEAYIAAALQRMVHYGVATAVSVDVRMIDDASALVGVTISLPGRSAAELRLAAIRKGGAAGWALSETETWIVTS